MVLPIALALMAAGGYRKVKQDQQDAADADEDRAYMRTRREREQAGWQREDDKRADLAAASAPRTVADNIVQPTPIGSRDVAPAADTLGHQGFVVGGQKFADRGGADAAAVAANDPAARGERELGAMRKHGDVLGAQQYQTSMRQGKLADLQLDATQAAAVKQKLQDEIAPLPSFDAVGEVFSRSALGGKAQARAVPSADGKKMTFNIVNADGSLKPTDFTFDNNERGLLRAKQAVGKAPIEQQLSTLHQLAMEAQQAAQLKQQGEHQQGMLANDVERTKIARMSAGNAAAASSRAAANDAERMGLERQRFEMQAGPVRELNNLRTQLSQARAAGDEPAMRRVQQQITDLGYSGKDSAAAHKSYQGAQAKLLDLGIKLASPDIDPGTRAVLERERVQAKAEAETFARELGVELAAQPAPTVPDAAVALLRGDPKLAAQFDAKYGKGAAAKLFGAGGDSGARSGAPPTMRQPAPTQRVPVDRIGDAPIGPLTSRAALEESAAAGNQRARRALEVFEQNRRDAEAQGSGYAAP